MVGDPEDPAEGTDVLVEGQTERLRGFVGQYADLAAQIPDFHLLGRLAEYKYYNIDAMAARAIALARSLA